MARLLSVLVLAAAGWVVWSYVVQPALRAPAAVVERPRPVHHAARPTATPPPAPPSGSPAARAQDFLAAWTAGDYAAMYRDLSPAAQQDITQTAFVDRYAGIAAEATITRVRPAILASRVQGNDAVVTYTVDMSTTAVGPITYTTQMPLHAAGGRWGVNWTPSLIFPGLSTYRVHLYQLPAQRGSIVDRQGQPLAVQAAMYQVGVVRQYIHDEKSLLAFLSGWLHMPVTQLYAMTHVSWAVANPTEFVPIAKVSAVQWNAVPPQVQQEQENNGLDVEKQAGITRRVYPRGTLAAPLLGYVRSTDQRGEAGLEAWADSYLNGHDGARLAIAVPPDFQYYVSTIKERPAQDGDTVHLTLDTTLQEAAEQAISNTVGAVVALRPSDGAVLAMASTPGFDPNAFAVGLSADQYNALINNPHHPLINRAATGQYPLGSIFKLVTTGAAMEKAGFTADTTRDCPGIWYGLGPAYPKRDWLPQGHGVLTLHEAIVQSCDTYFYQVGQQLDEMNHMLLPDYARSWGFGLPTGIVGVAEGAGIIPDPQWVQKTYKQPWVPGNAVDMAIGQGYVEVTPLQVAQMLAALANNGVMYRPYVVQRITAPDGAVVRNYPPVVSRTLPLSSTGIQVILNAMLGATTEPEGTATSIFQGFGWPVAGKTGTAQTSDGQQPDAWFAAIAPATHPTIALVVLVEHGGEGSAVAAPLARQILQTYFTKDQDLAGAKGPAVLPVP